MKAECVSAIDVGEKHTLSTSMDAAKGVAGALLSDDFLQDCPEGNAIGSLSTSGHKRLGADVEGILSIDNGALRIPPLIEAGFGRAVLAYGPFPTQAGLAVSVYMTNGHNTSQTGPLSDTFRHRLHLWLRGSEVDPSWKRLASWLFRGRYRRTFRQFRWWHRTATAEQGRLDENLAVGWFSRPAVRDPRVEGNAFIVHALGPENGELWAGSRANRTRSLRGVQNVPMYYVAVVRSEGTIYYVSSIEGAGNLSPYPWLRPVAIARGVLPNPLYAAIQQSVLGQIGFRLDTRVYGVRIANLPGYEPWWAGGHAADRLTSTGVRPGAPAEKGGEWELLPEAQVASGERFAVLDPGTPSGLVYGETTVPIESAGKVGLLWRFLDDGNHWRLELSAHRIEIVLVFRGNRSVVLSSEQSTSTVARRCLQVLDDGLRVMAYVDGEPLSDNYISDSRLGEGTKVGIYGAASGERAGNFDLFEAHPRQMKLPDVLDMGGPWLRKGAQLVIEDDFSGGQGDLEGRTTTVGDARWRRIIGKGIIELTGQRSARVRATKDEPCPGRTAYCIDWPHPEFADIQLTITPPGNRSGENQRTTAGFILYQDARNYVTLNTYRSDYYPAGSISTFFKFGGFEDVYDAVWSNVADRVNYGKPLRLRLCCDGERYVVFINDETVLYRAFRDVYPDVRRLQLRKLGIIANWEFGTDTGSKFEHLQIRF